MSRQMELADWIAVYFPKETILKEMSAKIEHVKPAYFFDLVQEFSDTSHT
jgi:hypothetical protein